MWTAKLGNQVAQRFFVLFLSRFNIVRSPVVMPMKTIKMSDQLHLELTAITGELTAESAQIKTYEDAVDALVHP